MASVEKLLRSSTLNRNLTGEDQKRLVVGIEPVQRIVELTRRIPEVAGGRVEACIRITVLERLVEA